MAELRPGRKGCPFQASGHISRSLALRGTRPYYDRPRRPHSAAISGAWGACMASGRDGPDGTAKLACDDTRDHRDHRRGYQSGHPHFQSARQPTSGAGEPTSTRRSLRNRRNNIRSCEFYFPLSMGIYGRCAVFSFERKDFYLRREMKKTNLKWEMISIT